MQIHFWYLTGGVLLVALAVGDSVLRRLPLNTTMLYVLVGAVLGPLAVGAITLDPLRDAHLLERATELVVIISLFAAGLKMRSPLNDRRWVAPTILAFGAMTVTVGLISLIGMQLLGLPVGAAIILGAVLAPTDPVLASEVQVADSEDSDRLRFALTGEAGLNDGTAFPFVMLGLGLLGLHEIGDWGVRWLLVDLLWAITGGVAIGALLGSAVGYFVVHLRREYKEAVGLDDFLALGLIALAYGLAIFLHTYGFLAVFAAGLALRRVERRKSGDVKPSLDVEAASHAAENMEHVATDAETAPAYMAQAVLGFSEQLERIGTVAVVLLVGAMLLPETFPAEAFWFVPLLLFVVRPLAVGAFIFRSDLRPVQKWLIAWFGVRGIGSVYYLTYATTHGLPAEYAARIAALVLWTVAASVVVHGVSATPLMKRYGERP